MKRALLVNGVPASGKSTLARALASASGWPLLALDTIKEALFAELGIGDRDYNRRMGRASYRAIFAAIGDFPDATTVIVDAWFGFQPRETLDDHLRQAGIARVAQVWCHAPAEVVAARYLARLGERSAGHLGAEYAPELLALATRAEPFANLPVRRIDTMQTPDIGALLDWARQALGAPRE